MKPNFKTPKEIAGLEKKERFGVNVPVEYMEFLRKEAGRQNITVGALVNEAIRAYIEFLKNKNHGS